MKGVKGKLMKKLQTIKTIGYLKTERILQVNMLDYGFYTSNLITGPTEVSPLMVIQKEHANQLLDDKFQVQEPDIVDVSELKKGLDDQELVFEGDTDDKENIRLEVKEKHLNVSRENSRVINTLSSKDELLEGNELGDVERATVPLSEIDVSSFRPPDMDSWTLFDPKLLAAFQQAVMEVKALKAERRSRSMVKTFQEKDGIEQPPIESGKLEESTDPLAEFEERCPPGGNDSVVLYTTGLRGIRKTFEDCHRIRSLLENLRIMFFERDISMHSEFKEELWVILGTKQVPPRLFIKGRYIGGAEEVLSLHELGKLRPLFEGIPIGRSEGPCQGCGGIRFIVCFNCNGSHKLMVEGSFEAIICSECNENGVIICPFCC
ncbi:hypothetical protein F511_06736 [Dorcoceras hygrometricum]|uniref:Glutaredoxin domain-containing protein n=1 Tax=Dorcoceras hygrometricum TaxID=472368 RepID=A0A2Z7D9L2_9LAMI|nr:hypothetical protein F511_06736 [Dorcoceras hygrometricum]